MKLLLILVVGCVVVNASISNEEKSSNNKEKSEIYNDASENIMNPSETTVEYYLYTKKNPAKGLKISATNDSIINSNFNFAYPLRIIIHGYYNSHLTPVIKKIRNAWLRFDEYNVVVVNWADARERIYSKSALAVPKVGEMIAHFIEFLVKNHGILLETTHVIGYGLGAHVAGYAGKHFKEPQINTIIGLNPTSVSFNYDEPAKRLNSSDAFYVETIQTEINLLSYKNPIGAAAFYPNGGSSQPGCRDSLCSHKRSAKYYAESITRDDFAAIKCETYQDAINNECGLIHSSVRMGGIKNTFMVSGIFYVPLRNRSPFGILP